MSRKSGGIEQRRGNLLCIEKKKGLPLKELAVANL